MVMFGGRRLREIHVNAVVEVVVVSWYLIRWWLVVEVMATVGCGDDGRG